MQIRRSSARQVVDLKRVQRIVPVFNKSQQDGLLPFVESGLVTFIGATTENPSFEVNSALLSRAQVYVLQSLSDGELKQLVQRACARVLTHLVLDDAAVDTLVGYADGDARRLLNLLVWGLALAVARGNAERIHRKTTRMKGERKRADNEGHDD